MPALIIRCPQCPGIEQGTSVPIEKLKQLLESREGVTVMGSVCGHTWKLSDDELKSLRKAIADGLL
jgi:hypothetical protein